MSILRIISIPLLLTVLFLASCTTPDAFRGTSLQPRNSEESPDAGDKAETSLPSDNSPVDLSITNAILMAIEHNRDFAVQRFAPEITKTNEETALAKFDPSITSSVSNKSASVGVNGTLPSGTNVNATYSIGLTDSTLYSNRLDSGKAGLTITQSLLQGAGLAVNLATLRQARLDTRISAYELRGIAETLVSTVEKTSWDYILAGQQIEIYENSLALAQRQLSETQERVKLGKLAEIELAAAQSEVATRREDLINARSTLAKTRVQLVRLLNIPGPDPWSRAITFQTKPVVPEIDLEDVAKHAAVAAIWRNDLNQARLQVQRGDLEVLKTQNGLLPKLDLFIAMGNTSYANSFAGSTGTVTVVGLQLTVPIGNRSSEALYTKSVLSREQAKAAVDNMSQLIEVDVRTAYVEVERTRDQIPATAAARQLREETLRGETEKFRVGKSTTFLVAQAQRDLLQSQIAETQAVVNYLKALVDLYRLEGSLLQRRGITVPGPNPVIPTSDPVLAKSDK
ncbi:MAG: TolC family protein [Candidatus Brocadiia bacterium]